MLEGMKRNAFNNIFGYWDVNLLLIKCIYLTRHPLSHKPVVHPMGIYIYKIINYEMIELSYLSVSDL